MMKLLPGDVVRDDGVTPLELFHQGIRAQATKAKYGQILRRVTCEFLEDILSGTYEERVAQFVRWGRENPEWARDLLISLSKKLRERSALPRDDKNYLNPNTIPTMFKPIKKLCDMNDIIISWKRVYVTFPELDNMPDSTGWTRRDIAKMLLHTRDTQDRAIILVLASSGMRIGALPMLDWGDITTIYGGANPTFEPGDVVSCGMVEVYRGSPEQYATCITPEALEALDAYKESWARHMGRAAKKDDPVFITVKGIPSRTTINTVSKRVGGVALRAGLRGEVIGRKHRVPLFNGFRRFWNHTCKDARSDDTLSSLIKREYMMGHKGLVPLDKNYYKTTPLELAAEYMAVVENLTISDERRLQQSNHTMTENVRKLKDEKDEKVARLEESLKCLSDEKDEEIRRVREDMELLGTRQDVPGMLAALQESGGMPQATLEALTGMVRQLGAAQEAALNDMRREYDGKIERLLQIINKLAKEEDIRE